MKQFDQRELYGGSDNVYLGHKTEVSTLENGDDDVNGYDVGVR